MEGLGFCTFRVFLQKKKEKCAWGKTAFVDDDKHSKESTGKMRGTRNDFDDDDFDDENDARFFTDEEASRWWWRLCFSTSM